MSITDKINHAYAFGGVEMSMKVLMIISLMKLKKIRHYHMMLN